MEHESVKVTPAKQDRDVADESIAEYSSAISYIADLIDQLKIEANSPELTKDARPAGTEIQRDESRQDDGATSEDLELIEQEPHDAAAGLDEGDTFGEQEEKKSEAVETPYAATPTVVSEAPAIVALPIAKQHHRNVMSNLREAAHMVTNSALSLSDCAKFAHRAYVFGCFSLAGSLFSAIFVLMSPSRHSFGFAASLAALSAALLLALAYFLSYRSLRLKVAILRNSRMEMAEAGLPIP